MGAKRGTIIGLSLSVAAGIGASYGLDKSADTRSANTS